MNTRLSIVFAALMLCFSFGAFHPAPATAAGYGEVGQTGPYAAGRALWHASINP